MRAPSPDRDPAGKEAAAWFSRLNTRSVSSDTLEAFRAWRQQPGHRDAYAEVERLWRRTGVLEGDPDIEGVLAAALSRSRPRPGWRGVPRPILAGCAAGAAALALAGGVWLWPALVGSTYATGVGEQRLVQLADGSRVRLDTDTRLVARFDGRTRRIRLNRGQAFFDVAHAAARPFVVEAGPTAVRALGTRFDVRRDDGHVQVTLVEGRVEVRAGGRAAGQSLTLRPGQQVTANGGLGAPRPIDVAAATSWTSGRIVFHAVPLRVAVAEVNRYSRRKIVLDAGGEGDVAVTGVFDSGDLEAFVAAVSDLHDLRAEPQADGSLRLRAKTPAPAA